MPEIGRSLEQICGPITELGGRARTLSGEDMSPTDYLGRLRGEELFRDAVLFLAHALSGQEAVWWASRSLQKAVGPGSPGPVDAAIRVAERWAADPTEANRRPAFAAAEDAGFGTPHGCLAFAVWSDSEAAPLELPGHPPRGQRMPPMVAKSLLLAAVMAEDGGYIIEPERIKERLDEFLRIGTRLAEGVDRWPDPPADPDANSGGPGRPAPYSGLGARSGS